MKNCENIFDNEEKEREYDSIKHIIKTGDLKELDYIEKRYSDNIKIQSALVKRYIKEKKHKNAIYICKKYEFYEIIQSQLVTIYIAEKQYEKAIEICNRFPDYKTLQSQLVTIYIKQRKYEEAIDICNRFFEYENFKGQLVNIYIKQNRLDKVIDICNKFPDCPSIQSQLITIYIYQGRLNDAISLGKKFPYNELIQYKLVTAYLKLNKLNQAINICKGFPENEMMQNKLKEITTFSNTKNDDVLQERLDTLICQTKEFYKNDELSNMMLLESEIGDSILGTIRSKIANNTIELSDIKLLEEIEPQIDVNIYKFILVSIYHRLGLVKTALQILKTIDQKYGQYKALLFKSLNCKKTSFYDLGLYSQIINWYAINDAVDKKQVVKVKIAQH